MSENQPVPSPQDERPAGAIRLRLLGALVALVAGSAALVIAILLVHNALSS